MELSVNKLKYEMLFIFFIISNFSYSQSVITPPVFDTSKSGKDIRLDHFLSYKPKLKGCMHASGFFKFQLDKDGLIDTVYAIGNLPMEVVKNIRANIKKSEKYWTPEKRDGLAVRSNWFIFPVLITYEGQPKCNENKSFGLSKLLLDELFEITDTFTITSKAYLIPDLYISGGI